MKKEKKGLTVTVMIEIPKGSRNKYEYDPKKNIIKFDRILFSAVHYPSDYGFFPKTLAHDGDPLDALVLVSEPTFPGCMIDVRPIGLFKIWNHISRLEEVSPHLLREIEHFFKVYKDLEHKKTGIEGWQDREAAIEVIKEAQRRHGRRRR